MPYLKNLKITELKNYSKAILPFGATEQHGPFLPLGTDSLVMEGVLKRIDTLDKNTVILPTLEITCSREHAGFVGTAWISEQTLFSYIKDVVESVSDTFSQIYLLTTHGGNVQTLSNFAKEFPGYKGVKIYYIDTEVPQIDDILNNKLDGGPIDEHAGNLEISTVYSLYPELVKLPPKDYPKPKIDMDWSNTVISQSKTGIVDNNPKWIISKELGETFVELVANYVVEVVNA
jgi:creatinine amidohydrolase/Fe(II)-dependent formamide hydrolase-like protein